MHRIEFLSVQLLHRVTRKLWQILSTATDACPSSPPRPPTAVRIILRLLPSDVREICACVLYIHVCLHSVHRKANLSWEISFDHLLPSFRQLYNSTFGGVFFSTKKKRKKKKFQNRFDILISGNVKFSKSGSWLKASSPYTFSIILHSVSFLFGKIQQNTTRMFLTLIFHFETRSFIFFL